MFGSVALAHGGHQLPDLRMLRCRQGGLACSAGDHFLRGRRLGRLDAYRCWYSGSRDFRIAADPSRATVRVLPLGALQLTYCRRSALLYAVMLAGDVGHGSVVIEGLACLSALQQKLPKRKKIIMLHQATLPPIFLWTCIRDLLQDKDPQIQACSIA